MVNSGKDTSEDIILEGNYSFANFGSDTSWEFTKDGKAYSGGNQYVMKG